jgi:hypothetical protein
MRKLGLSLATLGVVATCVVRAPEPAGANTVAAGCGANAGVVWVNGFNVPRGLAICADAVITPVVNGTVSVAYRCFAAAWGYVFVTTISKCELREADGDLVSEAMAVTMPGYAATTGGESLFIEARDFKVCFQGYGVSSFGFPPYIYVPAFDSEACTNLSA